MMVFLFFPTLSLSTRSFDQGSEGDGEKKGRKLEMDLSDTALPD